MILTLAFAAVCLLQITFLAVLLMRGQRAHEADRLAWTVERGALIDRVQSPDLVAYYGARQAWHPEEYPAPPTPDYLRDDFGYIADEAERPVDDGRLPGELPAGS